MAYEIRSVVELCNQFKERHGLDIGRLPRGFDIFKTTFEFQCIAKKINGKQCSTLVTHNNSKKQSLQVVTRLVERIRRADRTIYVRSLTVMVCGIHKRSEESIKEILFVWGAFKSVPQGPDIPFPSVETPSCLRSDPFISHETSPSLVSETLELTLPPTPSPSRSTASNKRSNRKPPKTTPSTTSARRRSRSDAPSPSRRSRKKARTSSIQSSSLLDPPRRLETPTNPSRPPSARHDSGIGLSSPPVSLRSRPPSPVPVDEPSPCVQRTRARTQTDNPRATRSRLPAAAPDRDAAWSTTKTMPGSFPTDDRWDPAWLFFSCRLDEQVLEDTSETEDSSDEEGYTLSDDGDDEAYDDTIFNHYHPPPPRTEVLRLTNHRIMKRLLKAPAGVYKPTTLSKSGHVYVWPHKARTGYVKIGMTTKPDRATTAGKCYKKGFDLQMGQVLWLDGLHRLAETLCHIELDAWRELRVSCAFCDRAHREEFFVGAEQANRVRVRWSRWLEKGPYLFGHGRLNRFWEKRLEAMTKEFLGDTMCTLEDLDERWTRFTDCAPPWWWWLFLLYVYDVGRWLFYFAMDFVLALIWRRRKR